MSVLWSAGQLWFWCQQYLVTHRVSEDNFQKITDSGGYIVSSSQCGTQASPLYLTGTPYVESGNRTWWLFKVTKCIGGDINAGSSHTLRVGRLIWDICISFFHVFLARLCPAEKCHLTMGWRRPHGRKSPQPLSPGQVVCSTRAQLIEKSR